MEGHQGVHLEVVEKDLDHDKPGGFELNSGNQYLISKGERRITHGDGSSLCYEADQIEA